MSTPAPSAPKTGGPISKLLTYAWDSLLSPLIRGLIQRIPYSTSGNPTGTQDGPPHRPGRRP